MNEITKLSRKLTNTKKNAVLHEGTLTHSIFAELQKDVKKLDAQKNISVKEHSRRLAKLLGHDWHDNTH